MERTEKEWRLFFMEIERDGNTAMEAENQYKNQSISFWS